MSEGVEVELPAKPDMVDFEAFNTAFMRDLWSLVRIMYPQLTKGENEVKL